MNADWIIPQSREVQAAVASLTDANLRRLFFTELQNPNWLKPLANLGVFATEPEPRVDDAGLQRPQPWPEGEYLARVASDESAGVTGLLLKHADSQNPWVHRVVLDAALAMSAKEGAHLVPQVVKALQSSAGWIDAGKIVKLAETLAPDHPKQARALLTGAFQPKATGEDVAAFGTRTRAVSSIDPYWYRELAPRVVSILTGFGMEGLKAAVGWLMRAIDTPSDSGADLGRSRFRRPSIAPSPQNLDLHQVSDALIDVVRDTAIELAKAGYLRDVVNFLSARDDVLLARIAVEATAQAVSAAPSTEAVEIAKTLLNKEALLDLDARPEYVHLALAAIPHLSPEDVAVWQEVIDAEAWQGGDDLMRRIAAYGKAGRTEVSDDDVAAVRHRMRYRLLLPLDEVLPTGLQAELAEMKAQFGEMEHPEFGMYMTSSFVGPTSPLDHDVLEAMSSNELRTFLETWQPANDQFFGPSREGLARELEVVAENKPDLPAALASDLLILGRSYVRAIVAGWAKALPQGFQPTPAVWQTLTALALLPDTGEDTPADLSTDDQAWRWAQRSAADFATSYMGARGDELTAADAIRLWTILSSLTSHVDPTPQHEEQFGGDNMDPLTLSLNTTRPAAIRAAVKLLRAISKRDGDEFGILRDQIFDMLAQHIAASKDPSLAVAAVIGESLGYIWDIDHAWIEERYADLFAVLSAEDNTRARADVVVSVAMRVYRTGAAFLELMRPVLLRMMSRTYAALDHSEGWRGDRPALKVAASHIVTAYVMGLVTDEDPLVVVLKSPDVSPSVIGDALGTLGWSFMHAGTAERALPAEVLERAQRLIDHRVAEIRAGRASAAELEGFYWWVRAEVFPAAWSLPILQLANTDPGFNPKGMLGESLARAAEAEPMLTIEAFDSLIPGDGYSWERYDLFQHAPRILVAALMSGDPSAEHRAREILDRLGRAGHLAVLAEVDQLTASR